MAQGEGFLGFGNEPHKTPITIQQVRSLVKCHLRGHGGKVPATVVFAALNHFEPQSPPNPSRTYNPASPGSKVPFCTAASCALATYP